MWCFDAHMHTRRGVGGWGGVAVASHIFHTCQKRSRAAQRLQFDSVQLSRHRRPLQGLVGVVCVRRCERLAQLACMCADRRRRHCHVDAYALAARLALLCSLLLVLLQWRLLVVLVRDVVLI